MGKGELVIITGKGTSATGVEMDRREQWLTGHAGVARREGQQHAGSTFTRQLVLERVAER